MRYTTIIDKNGRMVNNAAKKENSFPKNYHGCYLAHVNCNAWFFNLWSSCILKLNLAY